MISSPCYNCVVTPVCNKKHPFIRIGQCAIIANYIFEQIVQYDFKNGTVIIPNTILVFNFMFSTTHFPTQNSYGNYTDVCGVGLIPIDETPNGHVTIGKVPGKLILKPTDYQIIVEV